MTRSIANKTHGEGWHKTPEYHAWQAMRARCERPSFVAFKWYGGRGIKVCDRWQKYEQFLSDMGRKPTAKHSLDRIDNSGNYEPSNCRWATREEQMRNTRACVLTEATIAHAKELREGGMAIRSIARTLGVSEKTLGSMFRGQTWKPARAKLEEL